jgi:KaiC/GvpD/RAD55 family RecA-like ATPase
MIGAYQETIFFHYILGNPIFLNVCKQEFFSNPNIRELFEIAKDHSLKYQEPPSKEQLWELVRIKGISDKISEDVITALYNTKLELQNYTPDWLEENVGPWIRMKNLEYVMRKSVAFLKTSTLTVENTAEVVEKVRHMLSTETAIDFGFDLGVDFFDPKAHLQDRLARTSTGYSYLDKCLDGGWWKGSLICFLSGPKSGKSTWLGNLAAQSVYNGYNTAYITLELQREIVNMRIGSNMLSIPIDEYRDKAKDQDFMKKKLTGLKDSSFKTLGNLHVQEFPSATLSTNDLRTYLKKAEEVLGYKFENIFVDYINIMKNWRNPNSENLYMKIKQISEDLRAIAMEEQWAIITATQTNRTGWDTSDLTISNVSESGALLHTVDGLFGIVVNPEMKAKGECYIKYLADRVSGMENTRKRFTFDRKFSRIEEDLESQIEDLEYIFNTLLRGSRKTEHRGHPGSSHSKIDARVSSEANEQGIVETPEGIPGTHNLNLLPGE